MGGFDLTDIAGNSEGVAPTTTNEPLYQVNNRGSRNPFAEETEEAPSAPRVDKQEVERTIIKEEPQDGKEKLWDITSEAHSGGQFKAGEVDEKHLEFLKDTEIIE